jgi:hypothetical protein
MADAPSWKLLILVGLKRRNATQVQPFGQFIKQSNLLAKERRNARERIAQLEKDLLLLKQEGVETSKTSEVTEGYKKNWEASQQLLLLHKQVKELNEQLRNKDEE